MLIYVSTSLEVFYITGAFKGIEPWVVENINVEYSTTHSS
jgi:hypothetical protein